MKDKSEIRTIIEDTRQQKGKHEIKNEYFESQDIKILRNALPFGDYANLIDLSTIIDTKKDIQEIIMDVTRDHERFVNEINKANYHGIQLIFIIENKDGVQELHDLDKWYNWRLKQNKRATTGKSLRKILNTMQDEYDVSFQFCTPEESGEKICKILGLKKKN